MKKLALGLLLSATFALQANAEYPAWMHLERYAASNAEWQAKPNDGRRVVFLGNSITEGWVEHHPQFFEQNTNFIPRGFSGETTTQFLIRFRQDVINNKPAVVVILGGTNDVAENTGTYNPEHTMGNIKSMVELARAHGIKPVLCSVIPAAEIPWNHNVTDSADKIDALNASIKAYAEAEGIPYVDYYSALVSEGRALNPALTRDGVHPLAPGYEIMEEIIVPVVNSQLGK